MNFLLLAAIVLVGVALGSPVLSDLETEWMKFKEQHGKQYKSLLEETQRKQIFSSNYEMIRNHNKLYDQGLTTYVMGINERADMTLEERRQFSGFVSSRISVSPIEEVIFKPEEGKVVPESINWREKGAVTRVKSQEKCNACWAFSATGSLEAQYFLKSGKLIELSEQNLIECTYDYDNLGCSGGYMNSAFKYVHDNDGIDSESSYPYMHRDGRCNYNPKNNVTSLKGFGNITAGNEDHLKAAVAQIGPISVAIDADGTDYYKEGVFYNENCKSELKDLYHAVLVVGYGTENGHDYWLVKNSYSETWGDKGYIKMARNRNNNCGIVTAASYPIMY